MLYISTLDPGKTYTADQALAMEQAPDGGLFVPLSDGSFLTEGLAGLTFGQGAARVLSYLFQVSVTEHDVRLAVGRSPVRFTALANRILTGECWHNLEGDYRQTVKNLTAVLSGEAVTGNGAWAPIGVGIGVIFGIFAELMGKGLASRDNRVDISLISGDFSLAMAAWYARGWGLPIGNIVCCCNENHSVWGLFTNGMLRTDSTLVVTSVPEADITIPCSLERLIFACGGVREVQRYRGCLDSRESYYPGEELLKRLRRGMYISVVSTPRMMDIIPNAYATHHYLLSAGSALAYGGLLDYRAVSGESRRSLILSEKSPAVDRDTVSNALGTDRSALVE